MSAIKCISRVLKTQWCYEYGVVSEVSDLLYKHLCQIKGTELKNKQVNLSVRLDLMVILEMELIIIVTHPRFEG